MEGSIDDINDPSSSSRASVIGREFFHQIEGQKEIKEDLLRRLLQITRDNIIKQARDSINENLHEDPEVMEAFEKIRLNCEALDNLREKMTILGVGADAQSNIQVMQEEMQTLMLYNQTLEEQINARAKSLLIDALDEVEWENDNYVMLKDEHEVNKQKFDNAEFNDVKMTSEIAIQQAQIEFNIRVEAFKIKSRSDLREMLPDILQSNPALLSQLNEKAQMLEKLTKFYVAEIKRVPDNNHLHSDIMSRITQLRTDIVSTRRKLAVLVMGEALNADINFDPNDMAYIHTCLSGNQQDADVQNRNMPAFQILAVTNQAIDASLIIEHVHNKHGSYLDGIKDEMVDQIKQHCEYIQLLKVEFQNREKAMPQHLNEQYNQLMEIKQDMSKDKNVSERTLSNYIDRIQKSKTKGTIKDNADYRFEKFKMAINRILDAFKIKKRFTVNREFVRGADNLKQSTLFTKRKQQDLSKGFFKAEASTIEKAQNIRAKRQKRPGKT